MKSPLFLLVTPQPAGSPVRGQSVVRRLGCWGGGGDARASRASLAAARCCSRVQLEKEGGVVQLWQRGRSGLGASHGGRRTLRGCSGRLGGHVARETSQSAGSSPGSACTSQWRRRSLRGHPLALTNHHQVIVPANRYDGTFCELSGYEG